MLRPKPVNFYKRHHSFRFLSRWETPCIWVQSWINLHISRGVMDSDVQVRVICLMLAYTKSSMHGHERFRVWFWYLLYPLLRFTVQVVWNFEDTIRYVFSYIRLEINGGVLFWIIIIHIRMQLTLWTFHSIPMHNIIVVNSSCNNTEL